MNWPLVTFLYFGSCPLSIDLKIFTQHLHAAQQHPRNQSGPEHSFFPSFCIQLLILETWFWNLMLTLDRRGWLLEVLLGLHHILSALCPSDGLLWMQLPWWLQLGKGSQELKGDPKYDRNFNLLSGAGTKSDWESIMEKAERHQIFAEEIEVDLLIHPWHCSSEGRRGERDTGWSSNDSMAHSSQILNLLSLLGVSSNNAW